jgi:hypothetical protein
MGTSGGDSSASVGARPRSQGPSRAVMPARTGVLILTSGRRAAAQAGLVDGDVIVAPGVRPSRAWGGLQTLPAGAAGTARRVVEVVPTEPAPSGTKALTWHCATRRGKPGRGDGFRQAPARPRQHPPPGACPPAVEGGPARRLGHRGRGPAHRWPAPRPRHPRDGGRSSSETDDDSMANQYVGDETPGSAPTPTRTVWTPPGVSTGTGRDSGALRLSRIGPPRPQRSELQPPTPSTLTVGGDPARPFPEPLPFCAAPRYVTSDRGASSSVRS